MVIRHMFKGKYPMSGFVHRRRMPSSRALRPALALLLLPVFLAACGQGDETAEPAARPVRAVKVEKRPNGMAVTLTGRIEAEDEVSLAFRISGRLLKQDVNLGDRFKAGDIVARLEDQNEQNALRQAEANLVAVEGQFVQARNHFERQDALLKQGWVTRATHDDALQSMQTAESRVNAARAQLNTAKDQVDFTVLRADGPGVVTAVGPRAGTVVTAGQMIVKLARAEGRDAVFDVPASILRATPSDPKITVTLNDDPRVNAVGHVREVAPQANPVTRNFEVRVGLENPPAAMRLGATVSGRMMLAEAALIEIPASSLTQSGDQPAVWVVDPKTQTVSLRNVGVMRFDQGNVAIGDGLETGDIVVTAGVQALFPGQRVRLLGNGS
jgi:RND family efflux transporter MFP subunit